MKNAPAVVLASFAFTLSALIPTPGALAADEAAAPQKLPFSVHSDKPDHFIPGGYMGDYGDIVANFACKEKPAAGASCIQIKYTAKISQGQKWAGAYWQQPEKNWGTLKGGYNLTGAKKIVFMARGEKGGEQVEFKAGGITGEFGDTFKAEGSTVTLTPEWKQYEIDLAGQDLTRVVGGFCFAISKEKNPDGATFYLDEIKYVGAP